MRHVEIERPSFSGHETFALRYTWLKKGYEADERVAIDTYCAEHGFPACPQAPRP